VKNPYGALLGLRRIEEKEAHLALAERQRALQESERTLGAIREGRQAWLDEHLGEGGDRRAPGGLAGLIAEIERVERLADARVQATSRQAEEARLAFLERRRHREAVERLHRAHAAEMAREAARRLQAELDDLGAIGFGRGPAAQPGV
jgi:flagellar export protein FliJ